MNKRKHILDWISKRSIVFIVVLLFAVAVILIWFLITGFSQSQSIIAIGIAAVSAFFAAISSIAALLQAVETQKQREYQERPYVIAYFDGTNRGAMYFVIENKGNSPAVDVKFEFTPPPVDFAGRTFNEVSLFQKPINFLPHGKVYRQIIDVSHKFLAEGKPLEYKVQVFYYSVSGEYYADTTEFDLSYLKQATMSGGTIEENLEDISKSLKEIISFLKSVKGSNSLLVKTPDEYQSRLEELRNKKAE
jgi:hypothetical protein